MKKFGTIVFLAILFITVTSCKKYENDKFYSTYTVKGRLTKIGDWKLVKIIDINNGAQFNPSWKSMISFENKKYSFVEGSDYFQVKNITQIMKPVLESELANSTDSIEFSNSNDLEYTLSSNKKTIVLNGYLNSGYLSFSSATALTLNKTHDLEFQIDRLEIADMTLVYKNRLYFYYEKVKRAP